MALAFHRDGILGVATEGGGISLVFPTGERQSLRKETQTKVRSLAWRNQGEPLLAAGGEDGKVLILKSGVHLTKWPARQRNSGYRLESRWSVSRGRLLGWQDPSLGDLGRFRPGRFAP
jgi:hypothetical protein